MVFTCRAQNSIAVHWYFNGILQGSNGTTFSAVVGVGVLRISRVSLWFNETSIQCEAVFSNTRERSGVSRMLVQGE